MIRLGGSIENEALKNSFSILQEGLNLKLLNIILRVTLSLFSPQFLLSNWLYCYLINIIKLLLHVHVLKLIFPVLFQTHMEIRLTSLLVDEPVVELSRLDDGLTLVHVGGRAGLVWLHACFNSLSTLLSMEFSLLTMLDRSCNI